MVRVINFLLVLFVVVTGSLLALSGEESSVRWVGFAMVVAGLVWLALHFARSRRATE